MRSPVQIRIRAPKQGGCRTIFIVRQPPQPIQKSSPWQGLYSVPLTRGRLFWEYTARRENVRTIRAWYCVAAGEGTHSKATAHKPCRQIYYVGRRPQSQGCIGHLATLRLPTLCQSLNRTAAQPPSYLSSFPHFSREMGRRPRRAKKRSPAKGEKPAPLARGQRYK